jgi:hypothetical protein
MMRYHEALSRCLEAVAEGRDLEAAIAGLPSRHRERLRADVTLADTVRRHAATIPSPPAGAEVNALTRLNAELNSVRDSRDAAAPRGGFFGVPRFALAGLLLAALLVGASFIIGPNRGDDGSVEAAEFEGLVVANGNGSLTIQTLDTLEEVMVPLDARVLDENGAPLELGAIEAGEVVIVHGDRERGGPVRALDIRRRLDGLPGWCDENAERCRQVAQNLKDARARCESDPAACPVLDERAAGLIARVTDVADLEDLRQRCLNEGGDDCRDITSFCREHPDACARDFPPAPAVDRLDDARDRLQQLDGACGERDTRACRHIAQLCDEHPALCTDTPLRDAPAPNQRTR